LLAAAGCEVIEVQKEGKALAGRARVLVGSREELARELVMQQASWGVAFGARLDQGVAEVVDVRFRSK
jgi:hypothetical protein